MSDKYIVVYNVVIKGDIEDNPKLYRSSVLRKLSHELAFLLAEIPALLTRVLSTPIKRISDTKYSDTLDDASYKVVDLPINKVLISSDSIGYKYKTNQFLDKENIYLVRVFTILANICDSSTVDEAANKVVSAMQTMFSLYENMYFEIISYGFRFLEDDSNLGFCTKCGTVSSDHRQQDYKAFAFNGAEIEGKWYCEFDLPTDHPNFTYIPRRRKDN